MDGKTVRRKAASAKLFGGFLRQMHGDGMLFQQHGERLCVVGMLMRDENGIDVRQALADRAKRTFNGTAAHTRIDQYTGIADAQKGAVALGAGEKRDDSVDGGVQNKILS